MTWLLIVAGILTVAIVAVERTCWSLFRRKMEPLHFPENGYFPGSRPCTLQRVRAFAIVHTIALIAFTWILCFLLWW